MSLPQNIDYSGIRSSLTSLGKAATQATQRFALPKSPKAADTSKYDGLRGQVGGRGIPSGFNLGTVTVPYGGSTVRIREDGVPRGEAFHPGIDIGNKLNTAIPSFTPGVVTEVVRGKKQGDPGYGNYVIVTDPWGNRHRYSHFNQVFVQVGQPVRRGTFLGPMGNTGQAWSDHGGTGSHLDYRVRNAAGKYIRPEGFIYPTKYAQ